MGDTARPSRGAEQMHPVHDTRGHIVTAGSLVIVRENRWWSLPAVRTCRNPSMAVGREVIRSSVGNHGFQFTPTLRLTGIGEEEVCPFRRWSGSLAGHQYSRTGRHSPQYPGITSDLTQLQGLDGFSSNSVSLYTSPLKPSAITSCVAQVNIGHHRCRRRPRSHCHWC